MYVHTYVHCMAITTALSLSLPHKPLCPLLPKIRKVSHSARKDFRVKINMRHEDDFSYAFLGLLCGKAILLIPWPKPIIALVRKNT